MDSVKMNMKVFLFLPFVAFLLLQIMGCADLKSREHSSDDRLPPIAARGASLQNLADFEVPADSNVLIISEDAFKRAVSTSTAHRVEATVKRQAITLTGAANDPRTLGVLGNIQLADGPQRFQGTLFMVARDPALTSDGKFIQATDYTMYAMELSGVSDWVGTSVRYAMKSTLPTALGDCCEPEAVCEKGRRPPPGGGGCDPSDPRSDCPSWFASVKSTKTARMTARTKNDLPLIGLELSPEELSEGGEGLEDFSSCSLEGPFCEEIDPICSGDPGDATGGDPGRGEGGPGSTACVGSSSGREFAALPRICQVMNTWENLPAECGGICPSCGMGSELTSKLEEVPPICTVSQPVPESDMCDPMTPEREHLRNIHMQLQAGWRLGESASHCEMPRSGGAQLCTECNAGGECLQFMRKPRVNPGLLSSASEDCQGNPAPCQTADFKNGTVIVGPTPATDEEAAAAVKEAAAAVAEAVAAVAGKNPTPPGGQAPSSPGPVDPDPQSPAPASVRRADKVDHDPLKEPPTKYFDQRNQDKKGDPVVLADGSFHIEQTDLSFTGPVRPLEFRRTYNSRSRSRSTLGSNWVHNWDVWIQPLQSDNAPAWALPYCSNASTSAGLDSSRRLVQALKFDALGKSPGLLGKRPLPVTHKLVIWRTQRLYCPYSKRVSWA